MRPIDAAKNFLSSYKFQCFLSYIPGVSTVHGLSILIVRAALSEKVSKVAKSVFEKFQFSASSTSKPKASKYTPFPPAGQESGEAESAGDESDDEVEKPSQSHRKSNFSSFPKQQFGSSSPGTSAPSTPYEHYPSIRCFIEIWPFLGNGLCMLMDLGDWMASRRVAKQMKKNSQEQEEYQKERLEEATEEINATPLNSPFMPEPPQTAATEKEQTAAIETHNHWVEIGVLLRNLEQMQKILNRIPMTEVYLLHPLIQRLGESHPASEFLKLRQEELTGPDGWTPCDYRLGLQLKIETYRQVEEFIDSINNGVLTRDEEIQTLEKLIALLKDEEINPDKPTERFDTTNLNNRLNSLKEGKGQPSFDYRLALHLSPEAFLSAEVLTNDPSIDKTLELQHIENILAEIDLSHACYAPLVRRQEDLSSDKPKPDYVDLFRLYPKISSTNTSS